MKSPPATASPTAGQEGLINCHSCRLLVRFSRKASGNQARCPRCGARLHHRKPNSIARTWALVIAACIFYIPANTLPITLTTYLGSTQSDTILSGVLYFIRTGSWGIALIIFVASIVVPIAKLTVLLVLLISVQRRWRWRPDERTRLYRITELVGRCPCWMFSSWPCWWRWYGSATCQPSKRDKALSFLPLS